MFAIEVIDAHDEAAFDEWYAALHASATAGRAAPTVWTRDALQHRLRQPSKRWDRSILAAVDRSRPDGQQVLGVASVDLPLLDDAETADVDVEVLPVERGRGVGAALWDRVLQHCVDRGRSVLQAEVHVPQGQTEQSWAGMRFARARGFTSENVEDHLALDLPSALARLEARLQPDPGGTASDGTTAYELHSWVGRCPDELAESYALMRTLMNADVPTGGMVRSARTVTVDGIRQEEAGHAASYRSLVTLALVDGEPGGYTLVFVPLGDPDNLLQDDTYVMRAHRGHRLGERLKWANLQQVQAISPTSRWLHTWTEQGNAAMQRTNLGFGFEPVEVMHEVQLVL